MGKEILWISRSKNKGSSWRKWAKGQQPSRKKRRVAVTLFCTFCTYTSLSWVLRSSFIRAGGGNIIVSLNICRSQILCGYLAFFGLSFGLFFLQPYLTTAALKGQEEHREESSWFGKSREANYLDAQRGMWRARRPDSRFDLSLPPLVLEEKTSASWGAQNSSVLGFLLCSALTRGPLPFKN